MRTARILALGTLSSAVLLAGAGSGPAGAAGRGCRGADRRAGTAPVALIRAAVVCLVDRERTARGLPGLRGNGRLDRSAQGWSETLVRTRSFGHGADFSSRITAAGYAWQDVGENIATGFRTPRQVVRAWMRSPGHCRNILSPLFTSVGTGVVSRPTGTARHGATWTQDFGLGASQRIPSQNWGPASSCG